MRCVYKWMIIVLLHPGDISGILSQTQDKIINCVVIEQNEILKNIQTHVQQFLVSETNKIQQDMVDDYSQYRKLV